jgi:ubiquinone/menaquinone biosynthesis C-methylase UbiE
MPSLKNWDNQTWLSSKEYIQSFNNFVLKQLKLNKNSKILDIGCGRGKIIENLSNKLKLINKPVGLDIENYKDRSKKIIFKKSDAITYIYKTRITFDLILIKQTIHLLQTAQIIKLLSVCKNKLNPGGKIMILSLDQVNNEIPTFLTMDKKLKKSLKRDKKIFNLIIKTFKNIIVKSFVFRVKILRKEYVKMIKKRYISTLLTFNDKQILDGINEINLKYKTELKFKDILICLILNK